MPWIFASAIAGLFLAASALRAAPTPDTATIERGVVEEMNRVRRDPPRYAREVLEPMRKLFSGRRFRYPDEKVATETQEGAAPLEEAIRVLSKMHAVPELAPAVGLSRSAHRLAAEQAKSGAIGHVTRDGAHPADRIAREGRWSRTCGEIIEYGHADPVRIVAALLIDDGVADRGHRKNILEPAFRRAGVAHGPHPSYRFVTVVDFAGGFDEAARR